MSLCLVILNKSQIIIGADSRTSRVENGTHYAIDDDASKLHYIDNKIVFYGGSQWVGKETLERYRKSDNKTIENLNDIGKAVTDEFERLYPDAAKEFSRKFEFLVATFEEDTAVIYSLSSYEDYRIIREEGSDMSCKCAIGHGKDQALEYSNQFMRLLPVFPMYQLIFNSLSDEQMGGNLRIYVLNKDGVQDQYTNKIKDCKPIKRYYEHNVYSQCSVGPERGFVSTRSDNLVQTEMNATKGISVQKGDGGGSNWTDMFYVDTDGNLRMKDAFIELVGSLCTILLNPSIGIKISNASGDMFYVDPSDGKLKLAGDAEFSGTVLGAIIKTANSGARIEMSRNKIECYDSDNKLTGLRLDPKFKDVSIYYAGTPLLTFSIGVNGMGQPINIHLQNRSGVTLSVENHLNQAETNHVIYNAIGDAISNHIAEYHT